ncbi:low temperature requirement protein A [Dactylosporangium sp. NPDC049140]|uniref:low temperature requirement protein A n=1 Tax=Dactylosporangium sp. NPDC049140 TaxID=3155647 RepID=UPI0033CC145F
MFAVSQVAHEMVVEPHWSGVVAAFGLFATLWWTWIGFAVLYNRRGDDRLASHRPTVLIGSVPCAVAATQAHHAFEGHVAGFALALAGARLVLAVGYMLSADAGGGDARIDRRVGWGYLVAAALFALSISVPEPWHYVLWAVTLTQEGAFALLTRHRAPMRPRLGERRRRGSRPSREELARNLLNPPEQGSHAVDAGHLAERFGLFMIILLGEIVISVGAAALDHPDQDAGYWLSLVGGLIPAGALWWTYFNSAADINEALLRISGGNPSLAYSLYAGGHLMPAFSLLVIAAGVNLSLHERPPGAALWLVCGGLTAYLASTRAFSGLPPRWYASLLLIVILGATANLAQLDRVFIAPAVVLVAGGWAIGAAALVSAFRRDVLKRLAANPLGFLTR